MNNVDLDKLDNTVDSLLYCMVQFLEFEGYKVYAAGYINLKGRKMPCMHVKSKTGAVGCITTELGSKLINEDAIEHGCTPVNFNTDKMGF